MMTVKTERKVEANCAALFGKHYLLLLIVLHCVDRNEAHLQCLQIIHLFTHLSPCGWIVLYSVANGIKYRCNIFKNNDAPVILLYQSYRSHLMTILPTRGKRVGSSFLLLSFTLIFISFHLISLHSPLQAACELQLAKQQ